MKIHFLKIDAEGAEYEILRGCRDLLRADAVDYIQFEYGGTFLDAGVRLRTVVSYLARHGYWTYRLKKGALTRLVPAETSDDYKFANLLAVNKRLARDFDKRAPREKYDIFDHLEAFGVKPTGVLHIGAHEGREIETYDRANVAHVCFVEANPDLAARLRDKFKGRDDVTVVENAIADQPGTMQFHITSMDQSSSLLELHKHRDVYPEIVPTKTIDVATTTIDRLFSEGRIERDLYNVIALDIQGAEYLALLGAKETLPHVDAVHTEINYEELYKGGANISDLDRLLGEAGFIRVRTVTPHHGTWGDALYVRPSHITASKLGSRGRFGNQLFQYMFLRCYAKDTGYVVETPDWIGRHLFGASDLLLADTSRFSEILQTEYDLGTCSIANSENEFPYADFNGFFQYRTNYYEPHKPFILSLFQPTAEVRKGLSKAQEAFDKLEGPVIGIHIRRGDYGYGPFFRAPEEWYLDWLDNLADGNPVTVFLASDEPDSVKARFARHRVVTSQDLGAHLEDAPYYPDFYFLTRCDKLAISNSSFSFVAAMLNQKADIFVRPDLKTKQLIEFDPWNSEPLLRDEKAEDHGTAFLNPHKKREKASRRFKRFLARLFG